jgi:hypothetical protein
VSGRAEKETIMEQFDNQQTPPPLYPGGQPGGYPPPRRRDLPYKAPAVAGLLSGLMPGLGQVYVGYAQVGIILFLIFVSCILMLSQEACESCGPLFGISLAFVYLYGIIDGVKRAAAYNRALDGYGADAPPPELTLPGFGGSRALGVILVLLGVLLSAQTMFDVDLEWLADVWPLALVGIGVWLFMKARRPSA